METYTQDISLKADHTATYKEYSETKTESFTRSGSGYVKGGGEREEKDKKGNEALVIFCPTLTAHHRREG